MLALYSCSEGKEGKLCDLEELFSPRDSDDGDAQDDANDRIADCHLKTSEDDPQKVEQK
jgi:hypothetical protein